MSRSCVRGHRCAIVVIRVMNMVRMTTIVSATKHAPPQASPRPFLCAVLSTWGIGAGLCTIVQAKFVESAFHALW